MKKYFLSAVIILTSSIAFAQQVQEKEDNSFRIVAIVTLLASLFLAIRKYKGMSKK